MQWQDVHESCLHPCLQRASWHRLAAFFQATATNCLSVFCQPASALVRRCWKCLPGLEVVLLAVPELPWVGAVSRGLKGVHGMTLLAISAHYQLVTSCFDSMLLAAISQTTVIMKENLWSWNWIKWTCHDSWSGWICCSSIQCSTCNAQSNLLWDLAKWDRGTKCCQWIQKGSWG